MAPKKVSVTIRYSIPGTQPPVYLAGSFSNPQWQPQEMNFTKGGDGELEFVQEVKIEEGIEYQYKFRIGSTGDWWVLDEASPTASDNSGNRNNLLFVPYQEAKEVISLDQKEYTPDPSASIEDLIETFQNKSNSWTDNQISEEEDLRGSWADEKESTETKQNILVPLADKDQLGESRGNISVSFPDKELTGRSSEEETNSTSPTTTTTSFSSHIPNLLESKEGFFNNNTENTSHQVDNMHHHNPRGSKPDKSSIELEERASPEMCNSAQVAAEVAESATLVDRKTPTPQLSDEESGQIGYRRLSVTPIQDVASTAAEVAHSAAMVDDQHDVDEDLNFDELIKRADELEDSADNEAVGEWTALKRYRDRRAKMLYRDSSIGGSDIEKMRESGKLTLQMYKMWASLGGEETKQTGKLSMLDSAKLNDAKDRMDFFRYKRSGMEPKSERLIDIIWDVEQGAMMQGKPVSSPIAAIKVVSVGEACDSQSKDGDESLKVMSAVDNEDGVSDSDQAVGGGGQVNSGTEPFPKTDGTLENAGNAESYKVPSPMTPFVVSNRELGESDGVQKFITGDGMPSITIRPSTPSVTAVNANPLDQTAKSTSIDQATQNTVRRSTGRSKSPGAQSIHSGGEEEKANVLKAFFRSVFVDGIGRLFSKCFGGGRHNKILIVFLLVCCAVAWFVLG